MPSIGQFLKPVTSPYELSATSLSLCISSSVRVEAKSRCNNKEMVYVDFIYRGSINGIWLKVK